MVQFGGRVDAVSFLFGRRRGLPRIVSRVQVPMQRPDPDDPGTDLDEELVEDDEPELDIYFTLKGPKQGVTRTNDVEGAFFNHLTTNNYLRTAARWAIYRPNYNYAFPPKNDVDKARVARYFNLDPAFVATFTPNWNLLTILQYNQTTHDSYILAIIHNGHFPTELEQILHLMPEPGDPPNIQVFELCTYADHHNVPMSRFNIYWDEIFNTLQPRREHDFHRLEPYEFDDFIRSLQYMLLSYYLDHPLLYNRWGGHGYRAEDQPWYNIARHAAIDHNISRFGKSVDSYMRVYEDFQPNPGHHVLVQDIRSHEEDELI